MLEKGEGQAELEEVMRRINCVLVGEQRNTNSADLDGADGEEVMDVDVAPGVVRDGNDDEVEGDEDETHEPFDEEVTLLLQIKEGV